MVVYAGVDYERILRQAEEEADIIVWDGGNNDLPFFRPDLHIVVADPHRPGHEIRYHPGEANLRAADVVVINKVDTADPEGVVQVRRNIQEVNPQAIVVEAAPPIFVEDPAAIQGRRVLVIEDGPDIDPRRNGLRRWGDGGPWLRRGRTGGPAPLRRPLHRRDLPEVPAHWAASAGHGLRRGANPRPGGDHQRHPCDLVLAATPVDIRRLLKVRYPVDRARYELQGPQPADAGRNPAPAVRHSVVSGDGHLPGEG